jgi:hypothetical protein
MAVPTASFSPACSGYLAGDSDLNLADAAASATQQGLNVASKIVSAGSTIAAAIPIIGFAISGILDIFTAIFEHHAQAVKQEQQLGCAGIQAANNAFAVIAEGVSNGQIDPADAATALPTIVQNARSYMAPSIQNNPCNADCEAAVLIDAIAIYWAAQYQQLAAQNAANATDAAAQAQTLTPASSLSPGSVPVSASTGTTSTGASTAAVTTGNPAQITALQAQVTSLTQQLATAANAGDSSTAAALTTQINSLNQQMAALVAAQNAAVTSPNVTLSDIPWYVWAVGAGFLAWRLL